MLYNKEAKTFENQRKAKKSTNRKSNKVSIKTYIIKTVSLVQRKIYNESNEPQFHTMTTEKPMFIDANFFSHKEKCSVCDGDCGSIIYIFETECADGCCKFQYAIDKCHLIASTKTISQLTTEDEDNIIFSHAA